MNLRVPTSELESVVQVMHAHDARRLRAWCWRTLRKRSGTAAARKAWKIAKTR